MSLVEFLEQRISEDEAAATEVAHYVGPYEVIDILVSRTEDGVTTSKRLNPYHPVRALAECQAKRRIIGLHQPTTPEMTQDDGWGGVACRQCVNFHADMDCGNEPYPCPTLRLLAAPYAAHRCFDPSWGVPEQNKEQRQ